MGLGQDGGETGSRHDAYRVSGKDSQTSFSGDMTSSRTWDASRRGVMAALSWRQKSHDSMRIAVVERPRKRWSREGEREARSSQKLVISNIH